MVAIAKEPTKVPKVDFHPYDDMVLLLEMDHDALQSGVIIPQMDGNDPRHTGVMPIGLVVAAGPGRRNELNAEQIVPMNSKVGDVVYFGGKGVPAFDVLIDGEAFVLVRDRDLPGYKRKS